MILSKSLYARVIQFPKALWLKKYKPSVLTPPDASIQAVFETGNAVGGMKGNERGTMITITHISTPIED